MDVTLVEIRQIAQAQGWVVYVDEYGHYEFRNMVKFDPKTFLINPMKDRNPLRKLHEELDLYRHKYGPLHHTEKFGAFEELVNAIDNVQNEKGEVFTWN